VPCNRHGEGLYLPPVPETLKGAGFWVPGFEAVMLARVSERVFDLIEAAALPLVTTTGKQRVRPYSLRRHGERLFSVLCEVTGQGAKTVGADQVVGTCDDTAIANLPRLDAVADTLIGRTARNLIAKLKARGAMRRSSGASQNSAEYPSVKVLRAVSGRCCLVA
jgi:hypothetical protein